MQKERLFFWHFFHQIETQLSYERWIDKYKIFLQTLEAGQIPYEEDYRSFKQFCKFLYLQDEKDEAQFMRLLDNAIQQETALISKLYTISVPDQNTKDTPTKPNTPFIDDSPSPEPIPPVTPTSPITVAQTTPEYVNKYFHPQMRQVDNSNEVEKPSLSEAKFLHSDDYFPISKREMIKSWQYLRHKESKGNSTVLDIPATIQKVAEEGLFLEAIYQSGRINRVDTLIFFVDVRGSMMPFHQLSRRLIETAQKEGGHPKAPVYYFHDHPLGRVYADENLSQSVPLPRVFQQTNRNSTLAFIISDAGAARMSITARTRNPFKKKEHSQLKNIKPFLQQLHTQTAHIIWLNPMPYHRWEGTAAADIAQLAEIQLMLPVMEETDFDFQNTIRLVLKQK